MAAVAEREGVAAQALRFTILAAARTGEVRGMRWREVDLVTKVWTIPGDRMKAGRLHRVALSPAAVAILNEMRPLMQSSNDLVCPSVRKNGAPSDIALSEVVRRMNGGGGEGDPPRWRDAEGRAIVPHGFRSTFRDWAGERRPEGREVVEAALAHTIKDKSEAAYARSDLLEKRRPLMDAWAEQCARLPAEGGAGASGELNGTHENRACMVRRAWSEGCDIQLHEEASRCLPPDLMLTAPAGRSASGRRSHTYRMIQI